MSRTEITDSFGRHIEYLRVSITDRCNLRCSYCMPPEGVPLLPREDILTIEELARLGRCAIELGLARVRVSGGEPLVRAGVLDLVRALSSVPGLRDLAMTTNGTLLADLTRPLKDAGLQRVNVSLDSLDASTYRRVTRGGDLSSALAGVQAALDAGLSPVKVNVVIGETTAEESPLFAEMTRRQPVHVRFIERMPSAWTPSQQPCDTGGAAFYRAPAVRARLAGLESADRPAGAGPAEVFRLPGAVGTIGFISPLTAPFCARCNRLRLTASGKLLPCLFSSGEVEVRSALRNGASDDDIKRLFLAAAAAKPAGRPDQAPLAQPSMARVGG